MDTKQCTHCLQIKLLSSFHARREHKSKCKISSWCKACVAEKDKAKIARYKDLPKNTPQEKRCFKCKQIKPSVEFFKNNYSFTGIDSRCKKCKNIETIKYRQTIPGKFVQYKARGKQKGYGCDLLIEEFEKLFFKHCVYCGKENARGIDRVDSSKGYQVDNSVPCCKDCNKMKLDKTESDFLNLCLKIVKYRKLQ
mgnify:CR=1 FL=1